MKNNKTKVVITAGGTGGHIFPALTLKEELIETKHDVKFITDQRYLNYGFEVDQKTVILELFQFNKNIVGFFKFLISNILAIFTCISILKKYKPALILGFGGYPTLPVMIAARLLKIKIILHEQNTVIGRMNRFCAKHAAVLATSFPNVMGVSERNKSKVFLTGIPVRPEIAALHNIPYPYIDDSSAINIMVIGGSQGASIFADLIPEAVRLLPTNIRSRIRLDQQCRPGEESVIREKYSKLGISADISPFFKDVPNRLAGCHLVIARSGASTINELLISGKPAIYVPLPSAMDDHQTINAEYVVKHNAGWLAKQSEINAEKLAKLMNEILTQPEVLQKAANNAKAIANAHAVNSLINLVHVESRDAN